MTRQELIDEAIRKNKEERSKKHSNRTTFVKGGKPPAGGGRKKGSKNDIKKITARQWKKEFEMIWANLLMSMKDVDFSKLSSSEKLKYFAAMAKFNMAEMQSVEVNGTQVKKIEVSFSDEFTNKTIDITPTKIKSIGEGDHE